MDAAPKGVVALGTPNPLLMPKPPVVVFVEPNGVLPKAGFAPKPPAAAAGCTAPKDIDEPKAVGALEAAMKPVLAAAGLAAALPQPPPMAPLAPKAGLLNVLEAAAAPN